MMAWAPPALAANSAREQLQQTQSAISGEKSREQQLSRQLDTIADDLTQAQGELVRLADAVQRNERSLQEAEEKLIALAREQKDKELAVQSHQAELSASLGAAVRLSLTPPESALMMPGDFMRTLTAARVLSTLTETIRTQSADLTQELKGLQQVVARARATREAMAQEKQSLAAQRQALASKIEERRSLVLKLSQDQDSSRRRIAELSRQAKDLQELMSGIERGRPERSASRLAKGKAQGVAPPRGTMRMPVAGHVLQRFGEAIGRNDSSKGVILRARDRASVVAPFGGEVVFTGPFMTYGKIVILRHSGEFHTLLAGFDSIDVAVGQFLLEGEPIGAMGEGPSGTDLYVELRQRNQPVDPAPWMSGLAKN